MIDITRRGFLKIIGLATTTATMGCSADSARKLLPYIIPAEDIIPGEATWYATTCRECPAGCGIHAKNRDGRIIKVEGNPDHPVNQGALCARGQASLHGLYNPDRFASPQLREGKNLTKISWDDGQKMLADRLRKLQSQGRKGRCVLLTGTVTGTMKELIDDWLNTCGGRHLICEPLAYEPLRAANRIVFGKNSIPTYRIDEADFLISFGAGFLETWLSNVEYARRFASFHELEGENKNFFVYIGPRMSMTAASADSQIIVDPGDGYGIALALLDMLLTDAENSKVPIDPHLRAACRDALAAAAAAGISPTSVSHATLQAIADRFQRAKRPLVLTEGLGYDSHQATATAVAANLLNLLKPGSRQLIDFQAASPLSQAASADELKGLGEEIGQGSVDLLLIHEANPLFTLPPAWKLRENLANAGMIVSFSSCLDETTGLADLILPASTPFESWGDYSPKSGITSIMQPVMGQIFDTRGLGDIILQTCRAAGNTAQFPWQDFFSLLQERWKSHWQARSGATNFDIFWFRALQQGGHWQTQENEERGPELAADFDYMFPALSREKQGKENYSVVMYPTIQFFDGRGANRPWLQELPDPVTQTTWGGWVEMHPQTAAALDVVKGDVVRVSTDHGTIDVPVLPIGTVPEGTIALPIGQGHSAYGRYASGQPANPFALLPPETDMISGGLTMASLATIGKTGQCHNIANTDGSYFQMGRNISRFETVKSYRQAIIDGHPPDVDMPLPEGFDRRRDIYPAHAHKDFRWCMIVDLDRCIGCGACVVACYAENNVAIVGREQVLKEREMSWLRIQRYFDDDGRTIRYLPMLCQQCDEAPCESVCPIFAPQHSKDGLNNQVYNRCFGTRFCSQNDPYKVRRFNWFTFTRPAPLDWQLNPDVTVRQKGVMEKCSFCVQRIVAAKFKARKADRKLGDGEFTTACAQTCPTHALTFGNLKDPDSLVSRMIHDVRAYQVFRYLNTKPAVIYLKKLTQELEI